MPDWIWYDVYTNEPCRIVRVGSESGDGKQIIQIITRRDTYDEDWKTQSMVLTKDEWSRINA